MIKGKCYYESPTNCHIIPGYVLYMRQAYQIKSTHPNYHIKKYFILVNNKVDNLVEDLIISNCCHPNAMVDENEPDIFLDKPPKYSRFCLPYNTYGSKFITEEIWQNIMDGVIPRPEYDVISDAYIRSSFLSLWAIDNPHHLPQQKHIKTIPELPFY